MTALLYVIVILFISNAGSDDLLNNGGWLTEEGDRISVSGICNIERHDANDLKQEEFTRRYAYSEPVIIYNVENSVFRERTTKAAMLRDWADKEVTLNSANTYSYSRLPTTFLQYIKEYLKPQSLDSLGNETFYLFGDIDRTLWGSLLADYKLPKWGLEGHKPELSFGIAGAGTGVPFHFHGPVFAEVIYGAKQWFLYPYEARPKFDPDKSTLQYFKEQYPYLERDARPLECLVRPGEMIFVPDKWWHATLNTETSVFMSTFLSP